MVKNHKDIKGQPFIYRDYECEKDDYDEEEIVKHSKNIIDLIEEGDYVNGQCIEKIDKKENDRIYFKILEYKNGSYEGNCYIDLDKIKELAKQKDCTLTMYIAALYLLSLYKAEPDARMSKKPFILMIPVNLRKYFNSSTLRNFALFIKIILPLNGKIWDLDSIIEEIRPQFEKQLNKEFLQRRINYYVAFEKNFAIRILPLFIKNLAFKFIYFLQSNRIITTYISNLGKVDLPEDMYKYVNDVDFVNAGEKLYMTMATIQNKLNIMFSTRLRDHSIIYTFLKELQEKGIDIVLQTNHTGDVK